MLTGRRQTVGRALDQVPQLQGQSGVHPQQLEVANGQGQVVAERVHRVTARRAARVLFRKLRGAMLDAAPKIPEGERSPMPLAGKSAGTD